MSARLPPHTDAIEEEPFDSVISETTSHRVRELRAGQHRNQRALASRPWPISRRLGEPMRPVSPVA
jgi:hypothetical protein